jgi:sugar phosphate isomerase/epimerase
VCWDSGNYLVNDPDDYDLTETLDRILPYTELIQIKDVQPIDDSNAHLEDTRLMREPVHGIWQAVPTGTGHAQAERVVEQLRSRGWNKPVSMEMFCSPGRRDYYWALTLKWMRERSLVG